MKIDITTIEGFEAMTPEQKLAAIMGVEVPDPVDLSAYVKKDVFDAKASEAADLSKKLKSKSTDDENAAAEQKTAFEKMQSELEQLRTDKSIADHKASYATLGYDDVLSTATAKALASGDMATVFANQKAFNEAREKAIKADVLKSTPAPNGAGGGSGGAGEKSEAVSLAESIADSRKSATEFSRKTMNNYTGGKNSGV